MRIRNLIVILLSVLNVQSALAAKDVFGNWIDPRGYGCVTADTLLSIGSDATIRISDVRPNQYLINASNKRVIAASVTAGPETNAMFKITTITGKTITATKGHPFYNSNGVRLAGEFEIGEGILTVSGMEEVVDVQLANYKGNVWNLMVAHPTLANNEGKNVWPALKRLNPLLGLGVSDHTVVLNGFVSGDLLIQNLFVK